MGSSQSNISKNLFNSSNNVWESSSQVCTGSCNAAAVGTRIVAYGRNGDINVGAYCTANASCAMQSTLETTVSNIISTAAAQQNSTKTVFPFSARFDAKKNKVVNVSNITSNLTQVMQSSCQANSNTLVANTTIIASSSRTSGPTKGNINVISGNPPGKDGYSANASCTITNISRAQIFNSAQLDQNGSNAQAGGFGAILMMIIIIIVIGVVAVILVTGVKGATSAMSGSKTAEPTGEDALFASLAAETKETAVKE